MASLTFTGTARATGGTSALARALVAAAKPALSPRVRALGDDGKRRIVDNVSRLYTPRASHRSRSAPLHSPGNYTTLMVETPDGFRMRFAISGGDLFKAKFFSLNNGTRPHRIYPHGPYKLAFPWPNEGDPYVFRRSVTWTERGGKFGTHFYDDAIRDAIAAFR
jgi:hypothetical protein